MSQNKVPENGKLPLARFVLVYINPSTFRRDMLAHALQRVLTVVGGAGPEPGYTSFVAIVEHPGIAKPAVEDWTHGRIPGRIIYDSVQRVEQVLEVKYEHELSVVRYPGHKSHVPERVHVPEKLVIVIGSPYFLANHIELYLERTGKLRDVVIPCLKALMRLTPWQQARRTDDCFIDINVEEQTFYSGNFDAYVEQVNKARIRLSEAELEAVGIVMPDAESAERS